MQTNEPPFGIAGQLRDEIALFSVCIWVLNRLLNEIGAAWFSPWERNTPEHHRRVRFRTPGAEMVAWPASCLPGQHPNTP